MGRTPQEIFERHFADVGAGDLDAVVADFTEDAVVLTTGLAVQGRAAIREFFAAALGGFPEARFTVDSTVFARDALLLTWSATSPAGTITGAVDTFVFTEDHIRLQTTAFRVEPSGTG
jgi:hypothetical protein